MDVVNLLRRNWPEYLIEGWALGTFMLSAATVAVLLDAPHAPLGYLVTDPDVRRAITGIAMGLTAIGIIYSPWGKRSGAHMNPAVTMTFLLLRRIAPGDAAFFVTAQVVGGTLGVLLAAALFGTSFSTPPVSYVQTLPGPAGAVPAFVLEAALAFGMMSLILRLSSRPRLAPFTGLAAGTTLAFYIALEAPFSGMSINPARTLASALPAGEFSWLWLYFTAPPLGMLLAALAIPQLRVHCAKLVHTERERCIHCGFEPQATTSKPTETPGGNPS